MHDLDRYTEYLLCAKSLHERNDQMKTQSSRKNPTSGTQVVSAPAKELMMHVWWSPSYSISSQNLSGLGGMTVGHYNLNQGIAPVAIAVLDVACLLDQVNIASGTWFVVFDLASVRFAKPIIKEE